LTADLDGRAQYADHWMKEGRKEIKKERRKEEDVDN
jgi:hypothetical protein